jgi:hypothetical protein
MPLGKFLASAEAGETAMLCSWRLDIIIMELPPQETARRARTTTTRERTKAEDLRIDTSKQAVKGKR